MSLYGYFTRFDEITNSYRPKELEKTLREWQEGGDGIGGVDIVSVAISMIVFLAGAEKGAGMRDNRVRHGHRQSRCTIYCPL